MKRLLSSPIFFRIAILIMLLIITCCAVVATYSFCRANRDAARSSEELRRLRSELEEHNKEWQRREQHRQGLFR